MIYRNTVEFEVTGDNVALQINCKKIAFEMKKRI